MDVSVAKTKLFPPIISLICLHFISNTHHLELQQSKTSYKNPNISIEESLYHFFIGLTFSINFAKVKPIERGEAGMYRKLNSRAILVFIKPEQTENTCSFLTNFRANEKSNQYITTFYEFNKKTFITRFIAIFLFVHMLSTFLLSNVLLFNHTNREHNHDSHRESSCTSCHQISTIEQMRKQLSFALSFVHLCAVFVILILYFISKLTVFAPVFPTLIQLKVRFNN